MKYARIVLAACGTCIALLLVIALAFDFAAGDPVDAAKAKTIAEGWQEQDLALLGFQSSGGLFGRTAQVEFQVQASIPPKTIRVELQRPVYVPNWQVVGVAESTVEGE